MDMKEADCMVKNKIRRQEVANAFMKMNTVLAGNVVDQHGTLPRIHICVIEGLKQNPVDILLLLAAEEVGNAIRRKATMPCTCDGNNASNITGLGSKHRQFNSMKLVLTGRFLSSTISVMPSLKYFTYCCTLEGSHEKSLIFFTIGHHAATVGEPDIACGILAHMVGLEVAVGHKETAIDPL